MNVLERLYHRLDSSTRARVLVPTAFLFACTLGAMVVAAVKFYGSDLDRARRERAEVFTEAVATGVSNTMLAGKPAEVGPFLETLVAHSPDLLAASLIAPSGHVSLSTAPELVGSVPWRNLEAVHQVTTVQSPLGRDSEYAVLQPVRNEASCVRCHGDHSAVNGWLDLRFSRAPIQAAENQLARTLSFSAAVAFVFLVGIAIWLLGREAVSPLQRLVAAMKRAEAGELTVRADEGRPDELGVAARGFDAMLTALRRSQAELEAFYRERMVRADRFAAVGEMATGLAHEIKNPLAGLSGALELLAEDLSADARRAEVIQEMRHQVDRLTRTMEGLLGFARPPKAKLRSTDVNESLEKVLFLVRQQGRDGAIAISSDLAQPIPPVLADPSQLEQVFLNVCLNACQAMMPSGGGSLLVRTRPDEGVVAVEIADSGPGIPPDVRAQVFKPFFTTKREGNGLGLAISARIVAEHGGHIGYRCPPEGGTVFTITLRQAGQTRAESVA